MLIQGCNFEREQLQVYLDVSEWPCSTHSVLVVFKCILRVKFLSFTNIFQAALQNTVVKSDFINSSDGKIISN